MKRHEREVSIMVLKVIRPKGKYKDLSTYRDLTKYCLDPGKAVDGLVATVGVCSDDISGEMEALANYYGKNKGTRIRHMILSFDPEKEAHVTPEAALALVRKVIGFYRGEYQCMGVIHQNKRHLHAHIVMNTVRIWDGEKYKGRKRDWYAFLNHIGRVIKQYHLKLQTEY